MNSDELDARIDVVLKGGPEWEPPRDFARRVAVMAADADTTRPASWGWLSPGVFDAAMPGLLLALAGCVLGLTPLVFADNVMVVAWLSAGLTLWTAATVARRAGSKIAFART